MRILQSKNHTRSPSPNLKSSSNDNLQAHVAFTSKKALTPIVAKMFGKQWM